MKEEIWKDIKGFEGLYQVSSFGRVRSLDTKIYHRTSWGNYSYFTKRGKILKVCHNNKGYQMLSLYKNGKAKHCLVHRLVAEAFIPNPNNLPEVDHEDENKDNNNCSNLVWCDRLYNNTKGIQSKEGRRKSASFRMKPVLQYSLDGVLLHTYKGIRIAEEQTGINNRCIVSCCKGRIRTAGGYIWRYNNE